MINDFDKVHKVRTKSDNSLVTDIDLKVEGEITRLIKKNFPEDDILSEETLYSGKGSSYRWIVDPLDGTHNYIRRIPLFGTSIAIEFKGSVVIGVIYMPFSNELYLGCKGKGSYLNGKRIRVSKRNIREATMIYDSNIIREKKKVRLLSFSKVGHKVFNLRMFGSTVRSLSYVAEGKVDLEIEYTDKIWDFAAGAILVEEAGGKFTDYKGNKWNANTKEYIASNGLIHKDILNLGP